MVQEVEAQGKSGSSSTGEERAARWPFFTTAVAGTGVLASNPSDSSRRIASVREMGRGNHRLACGAGRAYAIGPRCGIDYRQDRVSEWWRNSCPHADQVPVRCSEVEGDMDDMVAFITGGGRASDRQRRSRWPGAVPESRWQAELRINSPKRPTIGAAGGTAITVTCDVSDEDCVRSAAASG